jgi:hypothetical protein
MAKPLISPELLTHFRNGGYVPCTEFHYGSCELKALKRLKMVMSVFAMFYGPAHILPVLIFKIRHLKKNFVGELYHIVQNIIRSVMFGSITIALTQYFTCTLNKLFHRTTRLNWAITSTLPPLAIFIEARVRRYELTLYLLPRALESVWNIMKKNGFPLRIKYFEVALFGLAMGILSYFIHNDDKNVKSSYKSSLKLIFGTN